MKKPPVSLTLLQRGVIQRLRDQDWRLLATAAHEHWSVGEPMPELDPVILAELRVDLRADLERANAIGYVGQGLRNDESPRSTNRLPGERSTPPRSQK